MTKETEISVIIPIYRNNKSLRELSSRIIKSLSSFKHEIIFVNDNSPDNSLEILQNLTSKYEQIKHLNLTQNIGQQKATIQGLKIAIGKKIVVLDGDLQDRPELIPILNQSILTDLNSVFVKRKGIYQSPSRMVTSVLIKKVVQLISGLHYKAGSYYMFDNSLLPKVLLVASKCKYPYLSIIVAHFSNTINYIPANRNKNIEPSNYNFTKRIKAAIMAIYCSFYCSYFKLNLD